jgi:hypothetical protein
MNRWIATLLFLLVTPLACAAESGYTYQPTDLKVRPFLDADTLLRLPAQTRVEILLRQGAWMQIRTPDKRDGWVRMLSVRLGSPDAKPGGGGILAAIGIGSRPRPQTTATVTTGVRGFSEEDLAKAEPNPVEAEKMKGFAAKPADANRIAQSGGLASKPVPYFDEDGKPLEPKK